MRRLLKPSQNDSDLCALPDSHAPYLYTLSLHDALPICGGGTERLPHLVGRGRALEIVLGANDFDGDTAERYGRSEEHTSELQSPDHLVCRLLLEKKNYNCLMLF